MSEQALAAVEAQRMRGMMSGLAITSGVGALIVLLLGGDRFAQQLHAAALLGSAAVSGGMALLFRNPRRYYPRLALNVLYVKLIVLLSGYYFWGVFSLYGALVPISIYIAAGSATRKEGIAGVAILVTAQTSFGLATVFGWIASRGLIEPVLDRAGTFTQLVMVGLMQAVTIGSALAGRAAHKAAAEALDAHNQMLVELARREAQLAEAHEDARAARNAGLGGAGRFTDQTIDGLKLGEVLGRGAMGEVYAAQRVGDGTPLAVKLLAPHLLRDDRARDRFLRESAIVSALTSPHVVRVHAVSPADAVLPYIVMERLTGIDLAQLLKTSAALPFAEIEQIVRHVAAALEAAHAAGVIHRDLKPSNIFAIGEGTARIWKLLDFGASRWRDGNGTLTQDRIVGTPGYMAPEQALGRPIDQRADVYAFGVLLYRLLTGIPPVVPGEIPSMLHEVAYRMPAQPSRLANVAPDLDAVLAIALAKSPMHRFATAADLATAFEQTVAGKQDVAIARRAALLLRQHPWGTWSTTRDTASAQLHSAITNESFES
jgi:serine/threonine-protein kinase